MVEKLLNTHTDNTICNVPPYLASCRWYAVWAHARMGGHDDDEAIAIANSRCGVEGKDFARCVIAGNRDSGQPMMLSVPVDGGASRLRKSGAAKYVRLSDHGNWRHVHSGAFDAVYGRMPYYQHLMPVMRAGWEEDILKLSSLNRFMHQVVVDMLDVPQAYQCLSEGVVGRGHEIASRLNPELSIVDALMKYGRETLLGLKFIIPDSVII